MAKATIDFVKNGKHRKYTYEFKMPDNPTKHNIAIAIATAKGKREGEKKYTGMPRNYNLIAELLNKNSRISYPEGDKTNRWQEIIQDANERNQEEKPFKVVCEKCNGKGCVECNGHGFLYKRLMWRVGYTFNHRHVIDIDGKDLNNAKNVKTYYEKVLEDKYTLIETNGGYWLIGNKIYNKKEDFVFAHSKLLNPLLKSEDTKDYIKSLLGLDKQKGNEFKPATAEDIKKSGLYHAPENLSFDVTFTYLSIKRERSTLRITAKRKGERIEIVV